MKIAVELLEIEGKLYAKINNYNEYLEWLLLEDVGVVAGSKIVHKELDKLEDR